MTYIGSEFGTQPSSSLNTPRSASTISVNDDTTTVITVGLDGQRKSYTWQTPLTGLWKDKSNRLYIVSESRAYDACRITVLSLRETVVEEGLIAVGRMEVMHHREMS